jgi:hypothetical protein
MIHEDMAQMELTGAASPLLRPLLEDVAALNVFEDSKSIV